MKKFLLSFISFLTITIAFSQEFDYDYQDGVIIFQYNSSIHDFPQSKDQIISVENFDFLSPIVKQYGIQKIKQLFPKTKNEKLVRTFQIEFDRINKIKKLINEIEENSFIEYAEQKELHRTLLTPNDPNYTNSFTNGQWALFQINAAQAWDISTGDPNIIVAITDNAIDITHPDLVNNLVQGRNAVDGNADPSPCGTNTGFHGTHVSGIAGAVTNNNLGISSIGFDISIMPVKIGNCNGSLVAGYEGITWAADNGADVINMSWGGGGQSTFGQNVCDHAWNSGAIVVAAAGNDNSSQTFYPANYNNVISVASTSANDVRSSFSQYGTWIDIAAPGSSILSCNESGGYQITQGTSMASPLVAGLVGLMKSHASSASQQDIVNCLLSSADNIDAANSNFIGQLGSGRINAQQALICMNQYTFAWDIGISSIEEPNSIICDNSINPIVVLKNFGSNTLTSANISYQISGGSAQNFNWTGNLSQGASDTFSIPTQNLAVGNYTLTVSSSNPNGNMDQNSANDSENSNFTIVLFGQEVVLTINTDCYGSETSWDIVSDATGSIIFSGGPYPDVTGGEVINEVLCMESGCYTFNIYDSYGDGMFGSQWSCNINGDYYLEDQNSSTIFQMTAANSDFGNQTSHAFCISSNLPLDAGIAEIIYPTGSICDANIAPEIILTNYGTQTLNTVQINYSYSGGNQQNHTWSGQLQPGNSVNVVLPIISVASGNFTFSAESVNPNGGIDQNITNNTSQNGFNVFLNAVSLPFTESFESNSFVTNQWTVDNPDSDITWELTTIGGTTPGDKAAKLDFYNYGNGSERDGLITPPLDFSNYTNVTLYFEHAFRRFNTNSADSLIIYTSIDCGNTFDRLIEFAEDGTGSFATNFTNTTPYTPSVSDDWCMGPVGTDCFTLNLNFLSGQPSVIVRFESFNDGIAGNNLFLDNINIDGTQQTLVPNANFSVNVTEICENESVVFNDESTSGPTNWTWNFGDGNSSNNQNPIHTYTNSGTYTVQLSISNSAGNDSYTESNLIVVNPLPAVTMTISEDTLCTSSNPISISTSPTGGSLSGMGINGNTFDPNISGAGIFTISYNYVNNNGCSNLISKNIFVDACSNISTLGIEGLNISPNPGNGILSVKGLTELVELEIFNSIGKNIFYTEKYYNGETIDISSNTSGVYYLRLSNGTTQIVEQILLVR